MRQKIWLLPGMALLLSACLPLQRQQVQTLKDLEQGNIVIETDSTMESSRLQALQRYREFLAAHPGAPLAVEAMRRLADLQLELGVTGEASQAAAQHEEDADPEAAIRLYRDLLATYPRQAGNDRVLYQLARAYDDSGHMEEALDTLQRLVEEYPDTPYVAEAHFRRAEMLFLRRDYLLAGRAYEAVLAFGEETPFYQQALYKYGWALFKQEAYDNALAAFFSILDSRLAPSARPATALSRAEQALVDDTLRVVSLAFSYLGGTRSVDGYFAAHPGSGYEDRVYASLGELYLDKERFHDAALAFQGFARRNPQDRLAPAFLIRAITAYQDGGFPSRVLATKIAFAQQYGLEQPFWQSHASGQLPETVAYLKTTIAELARHFHARAQHKATDADYQQAVHWYRRYLDYFPTAQDAPELHYLLAEALFENRRYREAALAYEQTAYDYAPHPRGAKAAHAALIAYKKRAAFLKGAEKARWQRRALASSLRFADCYPGHPEAAPALARAAQDYFALGEEEPATVVAQRLLAMQPAPAAPLRLSAWLVLGHSAFDRQDFPAAETAYRRALALMVRSDDKRAAIVERLASSIYKQGEALCAAGDLAGAAELFLQVAEAAPGSAIRATAEYDAAAAFITLQQWPQAIRVLEAFRKQHPGHPLQAEIPIKLAAAYLENGQSEAAAQEFERIGTGGGEPALRREALWRAAEMYAKADKTSKAAAAYKRYLKDFPQPFAMALEARQRLAELNLAVGNTRRYHYWLRSVMEADRTAGAARSERSRSLAAQAALVLARPALAAFRKVALKAPLEKSLKTKKQRMEKALAAYQQAADYGIAEVATAATFDIAEIYHDFSRALLESQRPKGLSEEELEQYDILLEEQAYPFEEEAIALHEVNSRHAAEGIYDRWVKASFRQLAELLPVRYAKTERSEDLVETIH
ncbi:MAG: tol-pal system YbgF family protein [Gammaproteobacteria bacterium]